MEKKFKLLHTILYAKDWYKRSNNIWDDLKIILTLDGYNGELMTKTDIVSIILINCQLLDVKCFTDLLEFASGIDKNSAYKNGYEYQGMSFQKQGTSYPEYDMYEAIIYYCISNLRFIETDLYGKLPHPDYVKGLKRRKGISNKILNEFFKK